MMILKLIGKALWLPVWLALGLCWLIAHLAVSLCGMLHGVGKLMFGVLAILSAAFGMWQNAILFALVIALLLVPVLAGAVVEVLLEEGRNWVWRRIFPLGFLAEKC